MITAGIIVLMGIVVYLLHNNSKNVKSEDKFLIGILFVGLMLIIPIIAGRILPQRNVLVKEYKLEPLFENVFVQVISQSSSVDKYAYKTDNQYSFENPNQTNVKIIDKNDGNPVLKKYTVISKYPLYAWVPDYGRAYFYLAKHNVDFYIVK